MADTLEEEAQLDSDTEEYHAEIARLRSKKVPLVEVFGPTIQGEGTVIGQQTYFLRFGLCDYKCKMCDSMHAVNPLMVKANAQWLTQTEIFEQFWDMRLPNSTKWLTFSGGNPAMHDLGYLVGLCKINGIRVNVETQGTIWRGWLGKVDSLTISPKGPGMGETHNMEQFLGFMDKLREAKGDILSENSLNGLPNICIKIVIFDQRDLEFAKEIYRVLDQTDLFFGSAVDDYFYLSLGNPNPPPIDGTEAVFDRSDAIARYKMLYEDIRNDAILSQMRFLPQWHAFVWGNDAGH